MTRLRTLGSAFDWRSTGIDWPVTSDVGPGLTGVVALETRVMWLDPSSGQLAYRGVPVDDLAVETDFEAVAHLLITGRRADEDPDGLESFRRRLRASRSLPRQVHELIHGLDRSTHPTRMLRAGISAVGCHELTEQDGVEPVSEQPWLELRVVGQVAALVGAIARHRMGLPPREPSPACSLAEGLLTAMADRTPTEDEVRALDLLWVLYAAHGLDAPTFASMVVASCHADPYYNIVAGLSALRGARAGGAAEAVLKQLLPLSDPTDAGHWAEQTLKSGGVIAGFGHPAYRMPDPRAVILRKTVASRARARARDSLFEVARAVETAATAVLAPRGVHVNVNYYGALLFHLLGAEPSLVSCLMAIGRMAGTTALIREAQETMRLYRPLSRYVGPAGRRLARGSRS
jgi:citrate synthase